MSNKYQEERDVIHTTVRMLLEKILSTGTIAQVLEILEVEAKIVHTIQESIIHLNEE